MAEQPPLATLNVGGRLFTVLRATLRSRPGSLLSAMFSGEWEPTAVRDEHGHPFIDRDADHFPAILRFMRDGKAPVPDTPAERFALRAEADYFGCLPLVEAIDAAEERNARIEAAREQRLLAEACLTHELAELVREANRELEATASAVEAARAKMVTLAADMQAATAEAQAAQRELQGGAAVVPPAERLRHRRRLHAAAVRWHALQDEHEVAAKALNVARQRQHAARAAKLAAIQVVVPPQAYDSDYEEEDEDPPRHLHPEEPIGWLPPPAAFEAWEEEEARREAQAAAAAEEAARRAAAPQPFGLGGRLPFAGGFGLGFGLMHDLQEPADFAFPAPARAPAAVAPAAAAPNLRPADREAAPAAPAVVAPAAAPRAAVAQPGAFGRAFNFRDLLLRDPLDRGAGAVAAPPARAPEHPRQARQAARLPGAAGALDHLFPEYRAGGNAAGMAGLGEEGPHPPQQQQQGGAAARPSEGPAEAQVAGAAQAEDGQAPPAAAGTVNGPAPAGAGDEPLSPGASPPRRRAAARRGQAAPRAALQDEAEQDEEQEQEQAPVNRPATRGRNARPSAAEKQEQEPAARSRRRARATAA